jgi:hypothetical protein
MTGSVLLLNLNRQNVAQFQAVPQEAICKNLRFVTIVSWKHLSDEGIMNGTNIKAAIPMNPGFTNI